LIFFPFIDGKNLSIRTRLFLTTLSAIGVIEYVTSKYKHYCDITARLASYKDWPKSFPQKPDVLARAGFFYTGIGDRVICFQCGMGLKDWDPKDDPFEQHIKWSISCQFLTMKAGVDFLQSNFFKSNVENLSASSEMEVDKFEHGKAEDDDNLICKHCTNNNTVTIVNMPCGHMNFCAECVKKENNCKTCSKKIIAVQNVYI
jgi:baculoviral IAP repeat-containing protein 7/8